MADLQSFLNRFAPEATAQEQNEEPLAPTTAESLSGFLQRFGGLSESYWFYDHTVEIRFDKKPHKYFLVNPEMGNLTQVRNVSTVAHIVDRSFALMPWAALKTVEKMLRLVPTVTLEDGTIMLAPMSLVAFTELCQVAKTAHKDDVEEAGEIGKMAHDWLESYILAILANDTAAQQGLIKTMCKDERATNCCYAALDWMKAHNVRWRETERKVYSREHQCSGTMDGLAICDSCSDKACCPVEFKDHLSVIDWKSANYLYIEFLFQTAGYTGFYMEEFPNEVIVDRWVNRLGKEDGEFESWHLGPEDYADDWEGFLACLHLKELVDKIGERMGTQKRNKRAIRKEAKAVAKEMAKAQERMAKAEAKALAKLQKAEEKQRIKAEAKANREAEKVRIKAEAKVAREAAKHATKDDTPVPVHEGLPCQPNTSSEGAVETLVLGHESTKVIVGTLKDPPPPNEALKEAFKRYVIPEEG